jgi:hypothetical protein
VAVLPRAGAEAAACAARLVQDVAAEPVAVAAVDVPVVLVSPEEALAAPVCPDDWDYLDALAKTGLRGFASPVVGSQLEVVAAHGSTMAGVPRADSLAAEFLSELPESVPGG